MPAKRLLAQHLEQFAERHAALALDLAVELDEGRFELGRQQPAERRFAAAAQADQGDAASPHRGRRPAEAPAQELACLGDFVRRQAVDQLHHHEALDRAIGTIIDELGQRHAQRLGDAAQQHDRAVAGAPLELRQVALGHVRMLRQRLSRHAAPGAQDAHALAQPGEIGAQVVGVCEGG